MLIRSLLVVTTGKPVLAVFLTVRWVTTTCELPGAFPSSGLLMLLNRELV